MLLIDNTYFIGELSLPNIHVSIPDGVSGTREALLAVGQKDLSVFVDEYVSEYLIKMFGSELTRKFLEEIAGNAPDEIWSNLKKQLFFGAGSYKASPLANYVYYYIMRGTRTKTTQAGEASPTFDNADRADNRYKMERAWNKMVDMTWCIDKWFCANYQVYEAYSGQYTGRAIWEITEYMNFIGV